MNSLHRQLTAILLSGLGFVLAAAVAASYSVTRGQVLAEFDYALQSKAQALTALPGADREGISLNFTQGDLPEFQPGRNAEYFQVWLSDGSVISKSASLGESELPPPEPERSVRYRNVRLPEGRSGRAVYAGLLADGDTSEAGPTFWLAFARDRSRLDRQLSTLLLGLTLGGALLMALISVLVKWTVRHSLRPIRNLTAHVTGIGAESLGRQFPASELPLELRPVGEQLNRLMTRLESAFARERRFSANAAHELITPIAELHALAEVALQSRDDHEHVLATDALEIADQMQGLVRNLLALTHAQSGTAPVRSEPVAVSSMIHEILAARDSRIRDRAVRLEVSVAADVTMDTDPALLGSILVNVIENAVEYTPAEGRMALRLEAEGRGWRMVLNNTNPGLTSDDMERLFEPLWRKDEARASRWHAGLGLSLVKAIAETLRLEVSAALTADGEFQVEIRGGGQSR